MLRYVGFIGLIGLAACGDKSGDSASDTSGGGGTDTNTNPGTCANTISETFPVDGATDSFYRTNVEFTLVTPETAASVTVTDAGGGSVAGTTSVEANRVVWTPTDALAPSTTYTATLSWSCADAPISFTTTDTGAPIGDPPSLVGNTYSLPLTEGRFVEPPGIGDIIGGLITVNVLIGVTAADATSINMMGAVASATDPNAQDMCTESIDFPNAADFTNDPFFNVGPDDTTLSVAGFDITVDDLKISGAFSPSADAIEGAALAGSIDTRPLVPLVASGQGDDGVCNLVATFGINCIDCADGSGTYCLAIQVEDMDADLVPGLTLTPIDAATAQANTDAGMCP